MRNELHLWTAGEATSDFLHIASGLRAYAARAVEIRVLRARWPEGPVFAATVDALRDGLPAAWSVEVGAPRRARGEWQVDVEIDGATARGRGRSPVLAVLAALPP